MNSIKTRQKLHQLGFCEILLVLLSDFYLLMLAASFKKILRVVFTFSCYKNQLEKMEYFGVCIIPNKIKCFVW